MRTPEPEEERPLAWNAILENTPVYSSDGTDLGGLHEVLGAEDIFHGLVVRSGPLSSDVFIPADHVGSITNRRIDVLLTDEEVRQLPPYEPEQSYHLGMVGLFRKHLGWVEGNDQPG